jgi:hypothetical protein
VFWFIVDYNQLLVNKLRMTKDLGKNVGLLVGCFCFDAQKGVWVVELRFAYQLRRG